MVVVQVKSCQIAYVFADRNPNATSYGSVDRWPAWIELRAPNRSANRLAKLTDLAKLLPSNELKVSIETNPAAWAQIASSELPNGAVVRERQIPGFTETLGINHHAFSPWTTGEFLYFLQLDKYEDILKPGNAGLWACQLSARSFELNRHFLMFAAELESGEKTWSYSRDALVTLFQGKDGK
jgi:hypothetical protein